MSTTTTAVPAAKCSSPTGCKHKTKDPSGKCPDHRGEPNPNLAAGSAFATAPPGAYAGGMESAELDWQEGETHPTGGYDEVRSNSSGGLSYTFDGSLHRADGASMVDADGKAKAWHYRGNKVAEDGRQGQQRADALVAAGAAPEDVVRWMTWDQGVAEDLISQRVSAREADSAEADGVSGATAIAQHAFSERTRKGAVPCGQQGCGRVTTSSTERCHDHVEGDEGDTTVTAPSSALVPDSSKEPEMAVAMAAWLPDSNYSQRTTAVLDACHASGKTAVMWGEPGLGKTAIVEAMAADKGMNVEVLIGSKMDPTDVDGFKVPVERADGMMVTTSAIPEWAVKVFDDDAKGIPTALFFDEASNTPPAVQAGLLTLLQSRTVAGRKLPDSCWFIAAANPADSAADGWSMAAPTANRMMHLDYTPPASDWHDGMDVAFGKAGVSEAELAERRKIVSFTKKYPNLLQAMPDNDVDKGRAWPSRRSWDNLSCSLGHASDPEVRRVLAEGFVGEGAATQFALWEKSLNLPDPTSVLNDPNSVDWENSSAERTHTILGSVVAMAGGDDPSGKPYWPRAMEVFKAVGERGQLDIGAANAVNLLNAIDNHRDVNEAERMDRVDVLLGTFGSALKEAGIIDYTPDEPGPEPVKPAKKR